MQHQLHNHLQNHKLIRKHAETPSITKTEDTNIIAKSENKIRNLHFIVLTITSLGLVQ